MDIFTDTISLGNLITITTGLASWSLTVISLIAWFNRKFDSLIREKTFVNFTTLYEKRHADLSRRLYNIELWAAKKNGPPVIFEQVTVPEPLL